MDLATDPTLRCSTIISEWEDARELFPTSNKTRCQAVNVPECFPTATYIKDIHPICESKIEGIRITFDDIPQTRHDVIIKRLDVVAADYRRYRR